MRFLLCVNCGTEQLLYGLHVFRKGFAAGFCHAVEGLRFALHKLFFDRNVAGFFEFEKLRAKVAIRRSCLGAEPCELRFLNA